MTEVKRAAAVSSTLAPIHVTRNSHPLAKVMHDAAIGSVDTRQLETLMARGLSPEEAVDRIVLGLLA